MKKIGLSALAIAGVSMLALSGCSSSTTDAGSSDTLNIYAWAGEIPDSVIAAFEDETGITVTVDTFDSNETMISKLAAGNSGYDIVEPSQYAVELMVERNLLASIDKSKLEGFDNLATKFVDPSFDPDNEHSIPWAWGTTGILYNEACTGAEVTGWSDMWNPDYSGKVYMLDNMLSAYIAGLQVNGLSATTTDEGDIETATNSLLEQKEILAGYNSSNYADLVSTGDACIAQSYSGTTAAKAVEANPDVHYIIPEEGGTLWTDSFSIVEGTDSEDAAYQWLNFTLQPEVAALLTDDGALASTNAAALPLIADQTQVENPAIYAPEADLANSEFIVDPGEALSFFNDGWTRVRAS